MTRTARQIQTGPEGGPLQVVVPTRGRPEALERCLAALRAQTVPVEPIVVEDDAGRGPAWARNTGAKRARGHVVLFCDDDCEPDPTWAERLAGGCPRGGAAAGMTLAHPAAGRPAAASQLLTNELQLDSLGGDGRLGFAPTSNLAVHRDLLSRVPFDEGFPLAAGEDREWCARAGAAGCAPVLVRDAIVRHRPDLDGALGLWRQQVRYGRGAATLKARGVPLAAAGTRRALLRAGLRRGPRMASLVALAQAGVAAGFAAERLGI